MVYRDWLHEWTRKDDLEKSWRKNADSTWLRRVRRSSKGKFFEEYAPDSFLERMRMCLWGLTESEYFIIFLSFTPFILLLFLLVLRILIGRL